MLLHLKYLEIDPVGSTIWILAFSKDYGQLRNTTKGFSTGRIAQAMRSILSSGLIRVENFMVMLGELNFLCVISVAHVIHLG